MGNEVRCRCKPALGDYREISFVRSTPCYRNERTWLQEKMRKKQGFGKWTAAHPTDWELENAQASLLRRYSDEEWGGFGFRGSEIEAQNVGVWHGIFPGGFEDPPYVASTT